MGVDHLALAGLGEDGQLSRQQVSTERAPGLVPYRSIVPLLAGEVSCDGWWDVVPRALIH
jgi:hypothetical protein